MNLFYEIHKDLPREGPGSNESTRKAYSLIQQYLIEPAILDIGCGPGMQTLELASLADGSIIATDINEGFLKVLEEKAEQAGFANKIKVQQANMKELPFSEGQFDLIWSEGAIFIMGFENGLKEWKKFVKPGGFVAVTELSWIKEDPPQQAAKFWNEAYPGAGTVEENTQKAEQLGFEVLDSFVLPESAWWEHYYTPLEQRLAEFTVKYQHDEEALKILQGFQQEIDLYRKHHEYYGYVFYVLKNL